MKRISYLLLGILAFAAVSCTSPEKEGIRIGSELIQAQASLREARIATLNTFLEKFDPARFLDRSSARETLNGQLDELQQKYEAEKQLLDKQYEEYKLKFSKNLEKQAAFESAYHTVVFNAPAIISDKEEELRRACDEIILKIIPPAPTNTKLSQDLMGRDFCEEGETGYFPHRKWVIGESDALDVEILECVSKQDTCSYRVVATINKQDSASWLADMQIDYTLGTGDDWSFHGLKCDNVMPQMTDTINDSISHHIDSNEGAQVLVIKNNYNKRIVVGGATNNGTDENWVKFSIFIEPKASARIDGEQHKPTADYRIDFVELG